MKTLPIVILLFFFTGKLFAHTDTSSLKEKVDASLIVFEGKVIADSAFWNSNKTFIYTLHYLLISKQFKGDFKSDTVVLIREENYSRIGDDIRTIIDNGSFELKKGMEGIFFCKAMDTHIYYGVKDDGNLYQINLLHSNCDGFINITCSDNLPKGLHRTFCCDGTFFNEVTTDLYEPIEKIVGRKYTQLRLNCLEQSKPAK